MDVPFSVYHNRATVMLVPVIRKRSGPESHQLRKPDLVSDTLPFFLDWSLPADCIFHLARECILGAGAAQECSQFGRIAAGRMSSYFLHP